MSNQNFLTPHQIALINQLTNMLAQTTDPMQQQTLRSSIEQAKRDPQWAYKLLTETDAEFAKQKHLQQKILLGIPLPFRPTGAQETIFASLVVNALRSEQLWPSNMSNCPQS